MRMKTKKLEWKDNQGIQTTGIEDSEGNVTVKQINVPKIWENYITELYNRDNRQNTNLMSKLMKRRKALIL